MQLGNQAASQRALEGARGFEPREIVMSLRWRAGGAGDLDALCLLQAADGRVLEVIHPGHERNANGSVVHTGDSSALEGRWNDERIFVFLDALPCSVAKLSFVVAGADSRMGRFSGAVCQFSDRISEQEIHWHELDARETRSSLVVATLTRCGGTWDFAAEEEAGHAGARWARRMFVPERN
jgi:stress response protein SCP2